MCGLRIRDGDKPDQKILSITKGVSMYELLTVVEELGVYRDGLCQNTDYYHYEGLGIMNINFDEGTIDIIFEPKPLMQSKKDPWKREYVGK